MTTCDCESYDCWGKCCGFGNCSCSGPYYGAKFDVILPGGTHRYWSTHCRHASKPDDRGHRDCSAVVVVGEQGDVGPDLGSLASVKRKPAQCKHCAAACVCPCHKGGTDE